DTRTEQLRQRKKHRVRRRPGRFEHQDADGRISLYRLAVVGVPLCAPVWPAPVAPSASSKKELLDPSDVSLVDARRWGNDLLEVESTTRHVTTQLHWERVDPHSV